MINDILREFDHQHDTRSSDDDVDAQAAGGPAAVKSATTLGGESVDLESPETMQGLDDDSWLIAQNEYGVPRGRDAYEARQIGETWAMELIKNAVTDQLLGGQLAFPSNLDDGDDRDDLPQAVVDLQGFFRDLLDGPHIRKQDWDDLVAATVSDMVEQAYAYWEAIPSADGSLPVAAFKPVDALTVRHNLTQQGAFPDDEPPFYQAPFQTFNGAAISTSSATPQPLQATDVVLMQYPGTARSHGAYAPSPAMQVRKVLELLHNSTTHHNRFYNDNEVPAGFLQIMQAGQTDLERIRGKIQDAAGDPRSVEVIGGEGPANWIDMGGQAINLDVIEEQKWFLQLCLAAFGLNKQEIGMVEDVNRSNGMEQSSIVFKRVTSKLSKKLAMAITRQVFPQFDAYQELGRPFDLDLKFSDPVQQRQQEEHLRQRWNDGGLSYREYRELAGEEPGDTTVDVDGETIDYGDYPKFITQALLRDAVKNGDDDGGDGGDGGGGGEDQPLYPGE